jgi:hypothetical protein
MLFLTLTTGFQIPPTLWINLSTCCERHHAKPGTIRPVSRTMRENCEFGSAASPYLETEAMAVTLGSRGVTPEDVELGTVP